MAHHASTRAAVRLDSVTKVYGRGGGAVTAINNVSVSVPPGTLTAVMGPSGSGKSTFLHCAAGLDRPTTGSVYLGSAGTDLSTLPEAELTKLRRDRIGFVFQAFNLLAALNVRENVTLPLRLAGRSAGRARPRPWPGSGCPTGAGTCPRSCPAASSSGWPSPAR